MPRYTVSLVDKSRSIMVTTVDCSEADVVKAIFDWGIDQDVMRVNKSSTYGKYGPKVANWLSDYIRMNTVSIHVKGSPARIQVFLTPQFHVIII